MSTPAAAAATTSSSSSSSTTSYLTNLGLGYSIAIALGFLVLLSSVLLASYICCRRRRLLRPPAPDPSNSIPSPSDGIILPRIIFVAEDDPDDLEAGMDHQNAVVGLDQAVINSYPKYAFAREAASPGGATTCSICLCEYKDSEMLRVMPECRHFFHLVCLDAWLKLNGSCPVCRNSPLPTPLSTPLSEVVPLSQYGDDRRRRR
ncbi:RING-H2 finger protein ATL67 [Punica granatum]|uniref:RING-type domain-containing protein n=2 Tax=Punica granatum TaxID=22663 RepID=A0A218VV62_PUNGR|nr:RING-H2 finger protein ATL67 [Punica granatum]OWM64286.1 hypothetical protein CDL15_Pgr018858 [Punica granatum]PKI46350.1 hypothetical protein CRG98_033245 [Punica granatum]